MAKKGSSREPDEAAGRLKKNVIADWLAETAAEKPDMAPLKQDDKPTKRPEGVIRDRESDRARGIEPEPLPAQEEDESSSGDFSYEPTYDPDDEEEPDFGSPFDEDAGPGFDTDFDD